jgi:hypothetical protein
MNERILCTLAGVMSLAGTTLSLAAPAKTISVSDFPKEAQLVEHVLVPVPSEVFAVLDKLGKPNWPDVLRAQKGLATPVGGKEQISLMLGVVIAEGFIAVEAENGTEMEVAETSEGVPAFT